MDELKKAAVTDLMANGIVVFGGWVSDGFSGVWRRWGTATE